MTHSLAPSSKYSWIRLISQINCICSIAFLLVISALTLSGEYNFFHNIEDIYGPLAGNLRLMLFYLCLAEITTFSYCLAGKNYAGIAVIGTFFLLLTPSLEFYGHINQVPIDPQYHFTFFYIGASHLAFGLIATMTEKTAVKNNQTQ